MYNHSYNNYIFPIPEIEDIIISYLSPIEDFKKIIQINTYYHQLISTNLIYCEFKEFWQNNLNMNFVNNYSTLFVREGAFITACMNNYLHVAKYLYSKYSQEINIHAFDDLLFRYCCSNGHLDVVKFLMSLDGKIDIHARNDAAFFWSCSEGHLEIIKWLYYNEFPIPLENSGEVKITSQENPNKIKINIHANNEFAFRISCEYGHLQVAQWLYDLAINENHVTKINIHAEDEWAFKTASKNGHTHVVQWLASICDQYQFQSDLQFKN